MPYFGMQDTDENYKRFMDFTRRQGLLPDYREYTGRITIFGGPFLNRLSVFPMLYLKVARSELRLVGT